MSAEPARAQRISTRAGPPFPYVNQGAGDGDKSYDLRPALDFAFFGRRAITFCLPNKA
jgi:hypothetical protein